MCCPPSTCWFDGNLFGNPLGFNCLCLFTNHRSLLNRNTRRASHCGIKRLSRNVISLELHRSLLFSICIPICYANAGIGTRFRIKQDTKRKWHLDHMGNKCGRKTPGGAQTALLETTSRTPQGFGGISSDGFADPTGLLSMIFDKS